GSLSSNSATLPSTVTTVNPYSRLSICVPSCVFTAAEAFELGLVNRVVPDDETVKTALDIAHQIAELPAVAVAFTKQAMNRAFGLTDTYDFERLEATYLQQEPESMAAMARKRSEY
ncbi:MAG: hypothetical protein JO337_10950, partial [Acidimicrobiales bacterium]|nr:hypothetical protein [Acidimicrobiales bacterium]